MRIVMSLSTCVQGTGQEPPKDKRIASGFADDDDPKQEIKSIAERIQSLPQKLRNKLSSYLKGKVT